MKKLLPFLFLLISCYAFADNGKDTLRRPWKLPKGVARGDYDPTAVIVKFKGAAVKANKTISSRPNLSLRSATVREQKQMFSGKPIRSSRVSAVPDHSDELDRIYELRISGTSDVERVINELLENEAVEYAEPRYVYKVSYQPNDELYPNQNYLAQVRAPQAWDFVRNSSGVVIAIVDSGSDLDHPDLAPNIYINTNDPVNGIDDDGDGFTDNYRGWDFIGRSAGNPVEDNDPDVKSDSTDHGVHVSGIASAATDNGIGVSAIAFNARLMIVKAGAD
ncbi:MAG TPA: S8 family serine peptidase, partial [Sphingobacteriaceae bacterium]